MRNLRSSRVAHLVAGVSITLSLGLLLVSLAEPAAAIPAFARKYQVSCTNCHAPFPRLKPYGEEFAARGFRMADAAQEPTRAKHDVGDPWLELVRDVPLAMRAEAHGVYQENAAAETDLEAPWVFKALSGGPLSPKISYYLYFIMEKGEVEGLEDAYLHFQHLFGSGVDVLFGQFQVSDPLFKRELRLSRADYEIYRTRVGQARANLTYDRGLMFFATAPGDVDVVFEVINGNGIPKGSFDQDDQKNLALRLAREIGPVRLGLFGYFGREDGAGQARDEIRYFGPDLKFTPNDRWDVSVQYLERRDDNPFFFTSPGDDVVTRGGFAEVVFLPSGADGRWAVTALYNRIRSDDPAAELEDAALSLSYLSARNIRLIGEVGHDLERSEDRLSFGVVAAF